MPQLPHYDWCNVSVHHDCPCQIGVIAFKNTAARVSHVVIGKQVDSHIAGAFQV